MKNWRPLIAVMVAMGLAVLGCGKSDDSAPSDMAALQGTWIGHAAGEQGNECRLIVEADTLEFRGPNPQEWYKGTFVLDEQAQPKAIDVHIHECGLSKYLDKVAKAIYSIELNTFTMAGNEPGSQTRPAAFGPDVRTFVFTKQK
jgi:uncharacterized protein (TIGR03067 family)